MLGAFKFLEEAGQFPETQRLQFHAVSKAVIRLLR
jgi:hypothetical protein